MKVVAGAVVVGAVGTEKGREISLEHAKME